MNWNDNWNDNCWLRLPNGAERTEVETLLALEGAARQEVDGVWTVAVFDYRAAQVKGGIRIPDSEFPHRDWCQEIGAGPDNHQVVVRVQTRVIRMNSGKVRVDVEGWIVVWFHDNGAYITTILNNLEIFPRWRRG